MTIHGAMFRAAHLEITSYFQLCHLGTEAIAQEQSLSLGEVGTQFQEVPFFPLPKSINSQL